MRRRTATLSCLLEGDEAGAEQVSQRARELADLAQQLSTGVALPKHAHKQDQLARLMALAEQRERAPAPAEIRGGWLSRLRESAAERARGWQQSARVFAAAASASVALSGGGVALAAERALPSDPLYPVKLTVDDLHVRATWDDRARGRLQLSKSGERIAEASLAVAQGDSRGASRAIGVAEETTFAAAQTQFDLFRGGDGDALRRLARAQQGQRGALRELAPVLGASSGSPVASALAGLEVIDVDRGGLLLAAAAEGITEAERLLAGGDQAGARRVLARVAGTIDEASAALGPALAKGNPSAVGALTAFEQQQGPKLRPLVAATGGPTSRSLRTAVGRLRALPVVPPAGATVVPPAVQPPRAAPVPTAPATPGTSPASEIAPSPDVAPTVDPVPDTDTVTPDGGGREPSPPGEPAPGDGTGSTDTAGAGSGSGTGTASGAGEAGGSGSSAGSGGDGQPADTGAAGG